MDPVGEPLPAEETLGGLFRRYAPYVGRVALRIVGRVGDVDDIVQDVFVEAMHRLPQIRDPAAVKGWLATITVRICSRRLRRRRYRQWLGFAPLSDVSGAVAPTASESERVAVLNLYRLLDELPPSERVAWSLRHVMGESLEEAADLCGCSLATVKRRIGAAQEKLTKRMRDV
jgi:RNA polymerase sigma-70 factor (ECF subfamily)